MTAMTRCKVLLWAIHNNSTKALKAATVNNIKPNTPTRKNYMIVTHSSVSHRNSLNQSFRSSASQYFPNVLGVFKNFSRLSQLLKSFLYILLNPPVYSCMQLLSKCVADLSQI